MGLAVLPEVGGDALGVTCLNHLGKALVEAKRVIYIVKGKCEYDFIAEHISFSSEENDDK